MEKQPGQMESMELNKSLWEGKRVFVTGHNGFKGSWMVLWLNLLGAKVYGFSLDPQKGPNFYVDSNIKDCLSEEKIGNIKNTLDLENSINEFKPEIIFHMAAQPLVRESYKNPLETYLVNVIGTLNLFEAALKSDSVKVCINITTDKCYENFNKDKGYKENDPLGGHDPYSSSKACSEILSSSYRRSFFNEKGIELATVRAGNVIGGGDWAEDRLIPDFIRSIDNKKKLIIRAPESIRPWQHVLDPLFGYLVLAEKLLLQKNKFNSSWNFGPNEEDPKSVSDILNYICKEWPESRWEKFSGKTPHEAKTLKLDISKSKSQLNWKPVLSIEKTLDYTIEWYKNWFINPNMKDFSIYQINKFTESAKNE